jgi:hypothetical protein
VTRNAWDSYQNVHSPLQRASLDSLRCSLTVVVVAEQPYDTMEISRLGDDAVCVRRQG